MPATSAAAVGPPVRLRFPPFHFLFSFYCFTFFHFPTRLELFSSITIQLRGDPEPRSTDRFRPPRRARNQSSLSTDRETFLWRAGSQGR